MASGRLHPVVAASWWTPLLVDDGETFVRTKIHAFVSKAGEVELDVEDGGELDETWIRGRTRCGRRVSAAAVRLCEDLDAVSCFRCQQLLGLR